MERVVIVFPSRGACLAAVLLLVHTILDPELMPCCHTAKLRAVSMTCRVVLLLFVRDVECQLPISVQLLECQIRMLIELVCVNHRIKCVCGDVPFICCPRAVKQA